MKGKKAVLDLGVNFAVLIIIGLIILGLLLYFMLKTFRVAEEKLPRSAPEIVFHASRDNPVLMEVKEIKLSPGGSENLLVSVFNTGWSEEQAIVLSLEYCRDPADGINAGITLRSAPQRVKQDSAAGFLTALKALKSASPGTYICNLLAGVDNGVGEANTEVLFHSLQFAVLVEEPVDSSK